MNRRENSSEITRPGNSAAGVIRRDELYTAPEFKRRLGIKDATLRMARRAGLRIRYVHGRAFVLGQDWIDYVEMATTMQ